MDEKEETCIVGVARPDGGSDCVCEIPPLEVGCWAISPFAAVSLFVKLEMAQPAQEVSP